ncbi:MAG: DUF2339 domain-containing protein [Verrucomicrobia bacterium]|nr:DUF2339 domain-containing protein [Verrucomicrobiota bacterium]
MNGIALLILLLLAVFVALPIVAAIRASQASRRAEEANARSLELSSRLAAVELQLLESKDGPRGPASRSAGTGLAPVHRPVAAVLGARAPARAATQAGAGVVAPPALPPLPRTPPVIQPASPVATPTAPVAASDRASDRDLGGRGISRPTINWEQFMGVKLFAWLGGLALFLGVGFFVKYSFDQGLISPPVRVAIGWVTGLGLLVGGLRLSRERYAVTVQALCATGLLILYADVFASCSFYHFISAGAAFPLMVLVTAAAFLLAVRLDAPAVAVLGLLGGFLTPPLLSTGEDHPIGLFGYLAILDVGLIAVALRKRWTYLALLAAAATVVMEFGWVEKFFAVEKLEVALSIFGVFAYLFVGALALAHRRGQLDRCMTAAALALPAAALLLAFYLLARPYSAIAERPGLLFGFVVAVDASLLVLAWLRAELRVVAPIAGAVVFLLLTIWTVGFLSAELLNWGLALYLVFAILHSVFPVVVERLRPAGKPTWWAHLFAPVALLLVLLPIFKLEAVSLTVWPVILLVDVLAIGLAVVTASLLAIVTILLLTVVATACWILEIPAVLTGLPETLVVIGGFALFFFVAGQFAANNILNRPRLVADGPSGSPSTVTPAWGLPTADVTAMVPALSAVLPFLLLTMVVLRLPLADPSAVFGLAALMVALLFGVVRRYRSDWLTAIGLLGVFTLECAWHFNRFETGQAAVALVWYVGFYAAFAAFPFLFHERKAERVLPWAVAALAGPAQFLLVYKAVAGAFPNSYLGLLPAAFVVPSLASLVGVLRAIPPEAAKRNTLLAFFGGVALFFITLVFPIQFQRQWITIGWALEGAALLWLLHRVPHAGLKGTGVGLLTAAFVRLALNPAVLHYHARTATPLLNWYLYAYGLVTLCLFAGARLLAPPRHQLRELNVPPILQGLGTVLAFLLLNLEIADYFSQGTTVTFDFSGNLARDMTYSLGWAVFAFVVMIVGITRELRPARYGGMGLLVVTLLKLFFHDLWSLGGLYRIGSLVGLALVLIPVSFLYQRFLTSSPAPHAKSSEAP